MAAMKRYRVLAMDFDTRAVFLDMKIDDAWDEKVKEQHRRNNAQMREMLEWEFGAADGEQKFRNFADLGPAPFSIIAFHNRFLRQLRQAFVIGSYYPALTAACALGERILNHLVLKLRDEYRSTPEFNAVYNKDSFDNWNLPISTLRGWGVLLPEAVEAFEKLRDIRNNAIHFNPDVDQNDRPLALEAVKTLSQIIERQFGAMGTQPWFIPGAVGTSFIRQSHEQQPFIREVYLRNCALVGPLHTLEHAEKGWIVQDSHEYPEVSVTDEEFIRMANAHSLTP